MSEERREDNRRRNRLLAELENDRRQQLRPDDHGSRDENPTSGPDERDYTDKDNQAAIYDDASMSHRNRVAKRAEEQKAAMEQEQEMRREQFHIDEHRSSRGEQLRNGSDEWDWTERDEQYTRSLYTADARDVHPELPQPPSRRAYLQAESNHSTSDTSPGDPTRSFDASPITASPKLTDSREGDWKIIQNRLEEERRKQEEKAEYEAFILKQREKTQKKEQEEREKNARGKRNRA
jgi:hypothetical protein